MGWASRVPAIKADFGLDEGALGLLLLVMGVGALVAFPLAGKVSDRLGAVRVTRWIAAIYLVSISLVGFAPVVPALGVALFLFGMSHGAMDVTMNAWGAEVERHMGRSVMSSFHAMWSLGAGLGAVGGFAATSLGAPVSVHFVLAAGVSALVFGPFLWIEWNSRKSAGGADDPVFAFPRGD